MSLTDYSQYESMIQDAEAPKALPAGSEVTARIISIREGVNEETGIGWRMVTYDIPDEPTAREMTDFFGVLDQEKMDAKRFARELYKFKNFAAAIGLDYTQPFDWEELIGRECWVILGIQKDEEFGDKNRVTKYLSGN